MALYTKRIFVPAGTTEQSPIIKNFTLRERYITRIDTMIDTVATKGLVELKMSVGLPLYKVITFPADAEDWIRKGESYIENITLPQVNLPFTMTVASPGTINNHYIIVSVHTSETDPNIVVPSSFT